MPTPTLVQQFTDLNTTGTSANMAAPASNVTAGNVITVQVYVGNTPATITVTDNQNGTYTLDKQQVLATDGDNVACFHIIATVTGKPVITISHTAASTTLRGKAQEWTSLNGTLDATPVSANAINAFPNAGSSTPGTALGVGITLVGTDVNNAETFTHSANWTSLTVIGNAVFAQYIIYTTNAQLTGNPTMTISEEWGAIMVLYQSTAPVASIPPGNPTISGASLSLMTGSPAAFAI